jgi:hypothetical protein
LRDSKGHFLKVHPKPELHLPRVSGNGAERPGFGNVHIQIQGAHEMVLRPGFPIAPESTFTVANTNGLKLRVRLDTALFSGRIAEGAPHVVDALGPVELAGKPVGSLAGRSTHAAGPRRAENANPGLLVVMRLPCSTPIARIGTEQKLKWEESRV